MTKVTSAEIRRCLEQDCGLTTRESRIAWRAVLVLFRDALCDGREVSLHRIGTLEPYTAKGRPFFHPQTRQRIEIPSRRRVRFRISEDLREELS